MKWVVAVLALATGHGVALAATPMEKVVTLLEKMKTKIEASGKSEQSSYDKYACWCEDTLSEKAEAITKAKDKLEELQNAINKNKGGLGSGGATIAQLNKDIGANVVSQKEATEVRNKEGASYEDEKREAEQCIGALEAAIKVLTGAGSKKGFLETLQEAQLLSAVGSMRRVLKAPVVKRTLKDSDLEIVEHFVQKPDDFLKQSQHSFSQTGNNPFGDYAPKSNQIQGILKSMYDSFTADLEKDNADEAEKQKAFESLMDTKKKELTTLQGSLEDETTSSAEKTKKVADDKAMRDDTRDQLDADEKFFSATKEACGSKAKSWAQRSRLRTQEISGIDEAIKILSSDDAKKTFTEATKFLQLSVVNHPSQKAMASAAWAPRSEAYKRLSKLASQSQNMKIAQIAIAAKTMGHFDDIIVMIDKMVSMLRQEEKDDIAHRDRCDEKRNANKNAKDDAEHDKTKAQALIDRLTQAEKDKKADITEIEDNMKATKKNMDDMTTARSKETDEYKAAVKADKDSIALLEEAQAALGQFYKGAAAVQVAAKPEPNTNFEGGDYKGSTGEAKGVMAILDMLKEDLNKEIKGAGQEEMNSQTAYEEDISTLTASYRAGEQSKAASEVELADIKSDKQDATENKNAAQTDLDDEVSLAKAIATDCDWVESHFDKRRTARKTEIDGLADAKDFLAGVGTESDLSLP